MNDVTSLDIYKKLLSFPWRPGDMLCLLSYSALIIVLVGQLLCMLYLMSEEYNVVTTLGFNKFSLEPEDGEVELLYFKPSLFVFLLNVANTALKVR